MAMNYATLVAAKTVAGSIASWVNYARLDVEQVLEEAQALIYQSLRVREMATITALTIILGDAVAALPTDFLDPIGLKDITHDVDIDLVDPATLLRAVTITADENAPTRYCIIHPIIYFDKPYPEAATLGLWHYKLPGLLSATNQTNFLTTRYPHLLRIACLARAASFEDDTEREQTELAKLTGLIQRANEESDLATRGSVLVVGPVRLALGDDRTNYAGVSTDQILKEAQLLIYQTLRVREMHTITAVAVTAGDAFATLPDRFLDPIGLKDITTNVDLDLVDEASLLRTQVHSAGAVTGTGPTRYCIIHPIIYLDRSVAADTTLAFWHYQRPELLTSPTETNFLTDRYLHLLHAACEVRLASFRRDAAAQQQASTQLASLIQRANEESDLATRGSVLVLGPVRLPIGNDRTNYAGLAPAQILKEAQLLLYQTLRIREMRAEATLRLGRGDTSCALPADFLDPIDLKDTTNLVALRPLTERSLQTARSFDADVIQQGVPTRYGIFSERLQFDAAYDAAATLRLIYFQRPPLLTPASGADNFLAVRYLHLLRAACEVQAATFRNDGSDIAAMQRLAILIERTNVESDLTYRGADYDSEGG